MGHDHVMFSAREDITATILSDYDLPNVGEALSLVVISPSFTATYALPLNGEVTIGRDKSVEIYVDDRSVSRKHAVVTLGPTLSIRDLGSSNGTRVCGERVEPQTPQTLAV